MSHRTEPTEEVQTTVQPTFYTQHNTGYRLETLYASSKCLPWTLKQDIAFIVDIRGINDLF